MSGKEWGRDEGTNEGGVPATGTPGANPIRGAWQAIKSDRALQLVIIGQTVFWALASLIGQDILTYAKEELGLRDAFAGVTFAMAKGARKMGASVLRHNRVTGLTPAGDEFVVV